MMMEYGSILQLIASVSGLLVAGGLLFHERIYGWRVWIAATLFFMSIGSIDIGLKTVLNLDTDFIHHRILFLVVSGCSLVAAIRLWRKDVAAHSSQIQVLFALVIAHFFGLIAFVMPFWIYEQSDFAQLYGAHLREIPAQILAGISFYTIHVLYPRAWNWHRFIQQSLALIAAGFIFSLLLGGSGITAIGYDQMTMAAMLFILFGQMILSCEMVSQLYETRQEDAKVIFKIRRLEQGLRVIRGGKTSDRPDLPPPPPTRLY